MWPKMIKKKNRDHSRALSYAFRLLSMRDYSKKRLEEKLLAKHDKEIVAAVLAEVEDIGLLDESRAIENYIYTKTRYSNWGPYRILRGLLIKGYAGEEIKKQLDDLDVEDILQSGRRAYEGYLQSRGDTYTRNKCYKFLQSRGFSYDHIRKILSDDFSEEMSENTY